MINGYLKYYLGIAEPDKLSNAEWAREWEVLRRIREREKEESLKDFNFSING